MDSVDYKQLYLLQDRVMKTVFSVEKEFYLTGGTCLSRFYQEKRYSDDLDFFTNDSVRFNFALKNIKLKLMEKFKLVVDIDSKSFVRFKVDGLLKIDFVNDIVVRYKEPNVLDNGFVIDRWENILSNKLTAVIGRDNPKDVFDIYLIAKFYSFDWSEILKVAHGKASFCNEDLVIKLKSFPIGLLKKINIIDRSFLNSFEKDFPILIEEINNQQQHILN